MTRKYSEQNLLDAGFAPQAIEQYHVLQQSGNSMAQNRLLQQQRRRLKEHIHVMQKQLDIVDYLLYHLNKSP